MGEFIRELVADQDVVLWGGAPEYELPSISTPFVVSINNHYFWQEGKGKYGYTSAVYHGGCIAGIMAAFMNQPPQNLEFVCQNSGSPYGESMKPWATAKGIGYYGYASRPAEKLMRGTPPEAYNKEFRPLIQVVQQPFTGVLAAYHLLRFNPKRLYICGMNFYANAPTTIVEGKRGEHNIEDNKQAMRAILDDKRAIPDKFLSESL